MKKTVRFIFYNVVLEEDKFQEKFPSTNSIAFSELPLGSFFTTSVCNSSRRRNDAILSRETLVCTIIEIVSGRP